MQACDPNWTEGLPPELVIVYGRGVNFWNATQLKRSKRWMLEIIRYRAVRHENLERLFHGQSFLTSIDETGRLVLPAKLRQKIGIDTEAYFIAAGDTFHRTRRHTRQIRKTAAWLHDQPDDFDPLTFLDGDGVLDVGS